MPFTTSTRVATLTPFDGTTGSSASQPRMGISLLASVREVPAWSVIANLRMDPYERGLEEGGGAIEFLARNMWLLVPIQGKIKEFFADFDKFPYQTGSSLNAGGINYGLIRQADAMKRLKELERLAPR